MGKIISQAKKTQPPALIHTEKPVLDKIMRDILNSNVEKVVVNNRDNYEKLFNLKKRKEIIFNLSLFWKRTFFPATISKMKSEVLFQEKCGWIMEVTLYLMKLRLLLQLT
jgi:hypothetical protein